jgi:hypothetical protein
MIFGIPMPQASDPGPRMGYPPGNIVEKQFIYVISNNIIKYFLVYLYHKSRAPNFGPRTSGPEFRAPNRVPPGNFVAKAYKNIYI